MVKKLFTDGVTTSSLVEPPRKEDKTVVKNIIVAPSGAILRSRKASG